MCATIGYTATLQWDIFAVFQFAMSILIGIRVENKNKMLTQRKRQQLYKRHCETRLVDVMYCCDRGYSVRYEKKSCSHFTLLWIALIIT